MKWLATNAEYFGLPFENGKRWEPTQNHCFLRLMYAHDEYPMIWLLYAFMCGRLDRDTRQSFTCF